MLHLVVSYQFSLLIWSPNPGVSVTVSFIFTPFSSMTMGQNVAQREQGIEEEQGPGVGF